MKITPAHDFNDFEVGRRHNLELINILTETGKLNDNVPEAYRGMDRFAARKKVVADLEALELVEKIEPYVLKVPYGDRSHEVIEPFLTDQWYVDAKTLGAARAGGCSRRQDAVHPRKLAERLFPMA